MLTRYLTDAIERNADYSGHLAGTLTEQEVQAMHEQVDTALNTINGDAGDCVVSARQLALLLNGFVHQERHRETVAIVRSLSAPTAV
ncbi:hypothetical protein AB4Y45_34170 [Paraburkholderia sp. EG287A]|uniref:hypothetical protein n=1 Tax=Paraburkholderia sp. EG287A TaxID=3237012 RepID=UPI0034D293EA